MNRFFTLSLCFLALSLSAQETITYPYNPDGDADGLVAVPDLQDILAVYGSPFSPAEIMVGDTALSEWIQILYQALQDQQEVIEAMQGAGGCDLQFPDGLSGLLPVQHLFFQNESYVVPEGKNLYFLNYMGGIGEMYVDGKLFCSTASNSPIKFQSPVVISSNSVITSTNSDLMSSGSYTDSFIGFLVDKYVESHVVDIRSASYTVPNDKYYVVNWFSASQVGNSKLFVNGVETTADANGGNGYWSHPTGLVFKGGDVLSPQAYISDSQYNLYGYLVDEDYFADCGGGGSSVGGAVLTVDSLRYEDFSVEINTLETDTLTYINITSQMNLFIPSDVKDVVFYDCEINSLNLIEYHGVNLNDYADIDDISISFNTFISLELPLSESLGHLTLAFADLTGVSGIMIKANQLNFFKYVTQNGYLEYKRVNGLWIHPYEYLDY